MTAPKLTISNPAALTFSVGPGGENLIHDVALVQALLGLKRAKNGRTYLRDNHVTGKYDRATADALKQFRLDQGDKNINRPLVRYGRLLNSLAMGQWLAVLEGTATPYKLATAAEPGEIKGEAAKLLSAERQVALKAVIKDIISDWGIPLDVEIKVAANNVPDRTDKFFIPFETLPLVAHFQPRTLWVHNGRKLSSVPNSAQFQARAKALYEAVETDLKARCAKSFGITDPVDVKIQDGLKDNLAYVVRTDLEGVEALMQFLLADWRKKSFTTAVRFLENYLKAGADEINLSREEARAFDDVRNAVEVNINRFWQDNLIAPKSLDTKANEAVVAITKNPASKDGWFYDYWERGIKSQAVWNALLSKIDYEVDPQSGSIGFGVGGTNLTSSGEFKLRRKGDQIFVEGRITHVWSDDGYNFNKNAPFQDESLVLERHKKAKPFPWKAEWLEIFTGELEVVGANTPNARLRGLRFELRPVF